MSVVASQVKPYSHFMEDVKSHATAGSTIWLDPSKVSFAVFQAVTEAADVGSQGKFVVKLFCVVEQLLVFVSRQPLCLMMCDSTRRRSCMC